MISKKGALSSINTLVSNVFELNVISNQFAVEVGYMKTTVNIHTYILRTILTTFFSFKFFPKDFMLEKVAHYPPVCIIIYVHGYLG